jgi:hypothetical protein
VKRIAVVAVALGALAAPALAHATAPPIARPDPVTYPIKLDYTSPLPTLQPFEQDVISASVDDLESLVYEKTADLGGFIVAPLGQTALSSGGRDVLPPATYKPQIPLFALAAGKISSFTFTGTPTGPTLPPDNGNGVTPPVPPTPENVVPPANEGFGGNGNTGGGGSGGSTTTKSSGSGGGTTTTTRRPPTTTTATTATTATTGTTGTTTTSVTTTTARGGSGGGGCSGGTCSPGSCGTPGISITSTAPSCTITLTNASPGDSAQETMTIQNTSGSPYTLSLEETGPNNNHLWQDLQMAVYDPTGGIPTPPYPLLTSWLGSFHALTTLNPGQTVLYVIVLYLPTTAGNADQGKSAVVDFTWQAS